MLSIKKVAEVAQLVVTAHPSRKDHFADPLIQCVELPATFLPGDNCQLAYDCNHCRQTISFDPNNKAFIAAKTWSLKRLGGQLDLLDQLGALLNLKLHAPIENGVEIARYYTAVLDIASVGYYRCAHCEAQYLIAYATHGTDNEGRGMPESDTMHVQCIAQVKLDEQELLAAFRKTVPITV